jgi:hypothetical protein
MKDLERRYIEDLKRNGEKRGKKYKQDKNSLIIEESGTVED